MRGKGKNERKKPEKESARIRAKTWLHGALWGKSGHPGKSIRTRIETLAGVSFSKGETLVIRANP